jgi:hypothetical protein
VTTLENAIPHNKAVSMMLTNSLRQSKALVLPSETGGPNRQNIRRTDINNGATSCPGWINQRLAANG